MNVSSSAAVYGLQHCLASKGWKIIIADESHTLRTSEKPPDARHTEAAVSAVRRSRRAVFLTGTPSLSRPFDLYRQVRLQVSQHVLYADPKHVYNCCCVESRLVSMP